MRSISRSALLLVALLVSACSSVAVQASAAPAPSALHRSGQLSRAELDTQRGRKLGEAIRALDGGLLMSRGEALQVWIDGVAYGPEMLDRIPANDVQAVARLSAADARQMYGERAIGAGIVVTTRRR